MKVANGVLTLIFLLFAGWQYNDPDPYIWVPIYGFVAVVCALAVRGQYEPKVILGGLAILGVFTLSYLPDFYHWVQMGMPSLVETMKADKPYIELTREFGGLVIADAVLAFQYFQARKRV